MFEGVKPNSSELLKIFIKYLNLLFFNHFSFFTIYVSAKRCSQLARRVEASAFYAGHHAVYCFAHERASINGPAPLIPIEIEMSPVNSDNEESNNAKRHRSSSTTSALHISTSADQRFPSLFLSFNFP